MKKLTLLICAASVSLTQSCTVLGFAGDLALRSTVEELNEGRDRNDPLYVESSFLTNKGLEQDFKIVSDVLKDISKTKQANTVITEQQTRLFSANYANKELCQQANSVVGECHDADYYQQFYIKDEVDNTELLVEPDL